jgi:hypothetical protein
MRNRVVLAIGSLLVAAIATLALGRQIGQAEKLEGADDR